MAGLLAVVRGGLVSTLLGAVVLAASMAACPAADLGGSSRFPVPPADGVPCESPEAKAFDSVWLGHFSGGYSHYIGVGGPIVLDWRDEKLCFPSRRTYDHYMTTMRRDFHRPEGYFTCLVIR